MPTNVDGFVRQGPSYGCVCVCVRGNGTAAPGHRAQGAEKWAAKLILK